MSERDDEIDELRRQRIEELQERQQDEASGEVDKDAFTHRAIGHAHLFDAQ